MEKIKSTLKRFGFIEIIDNNTNFAKVFYNNKINRTIYIFSENGKRFNFSGNISYCDNKHTLDWIVKQCKCLDTAKYAIIGFLNTSAFN